MTAFVKSISDLRAGDHLCSIFNTDADQRALLVAFFRDAIARNEKILYIADTTPIDGLRADLTTAGVAIADLETRGQIHWLTANEAYLVNNVFNPDDVIHTLEIETRAALDAGFAALRISGEMTWSLRGATGSERILEYEARLNHFFPSHRCLAICQYDRRRFDAALLLDIIRAHPLIIVGTQVLENFYYQPPEELLGANLPEATLEQWIRNLRAHQKTELAIQQVNLELEAQVEQRTAQLALTNAQLQSEIGERQHAIESLRASEELYRAVFHTSPAGIVLVDPATQRIVQANPEFLRLVEYSAAEIVQLTISQLTYPSDLRSELAQAQNPGSNDETFTREKRLISKNGKARWVQMTSQSLADPVGVPHYQLCIVQNITDRKREEERLETLFAISRMTEKSEQAILDYALEQALHITESRVGYIYHYDETTKQFTLYSWSKEVMQECTIQDPQSVYDLDKTGIWGEAVRQRQTIIVNDFAAPNAFKKGYPEGHVALDRYMTVPIFEDNQIIAVVGVGNKADPYTTRDEKELSLLMHGLWRILHQQRAHEAMRETDALYRAVVENSPSIILLLQGEKIFYINPATAQLLGFATNQELFQHSVPELVHPASLADVRARLRRLAQGEANPPMIIQMQHRNGIEMFVETVSVPVQLHDENFALIIGQEITQRQKQEQALRESEEQFRTLFDTMMQGAFYQRADGTLTDVNTAALEMFGISREEFSRRTSYDPQWRVIHEDGSPFLLDDHPSMQALRSGKPVRDTIAGVFNPQRNAFVWLTINAVPQFRPGETQPYRAFVTLHDITELKTIEDQLRRLNLYNRGLIEASLDPLVTIFENGKIGDVNAATELVTGIPRAQLIGTDFSDYFSEPAKARAGYQRAFIEGVVRDLELAIRHKDGTLTPVLYSATVYRDGQGKVLGIFAAARDITERKRDEESLLTANTELDHYIRTLEARHVQVVLVNQMSDLLQTCHSQQEAYAVVKEYAPRLFPNTAGAFLIATQNRNLVETALMWGDLTPAEQVFATSDCWALRRNRPNLSKPGTSMQCRHVHQAGQSLCVPMLAQNQMVGMLYLFQAAPIAPENFWNDETISFAESTAQRLSLTLSNLNLQEILRDQAIHEPLTGLFNRRYFEEMLARELLRAQRSRQPLAVILMDLDHLKAINDHFGHEAGDASLRALGDLIKSQVRGDDIACRFGGDEFILVMTNTNLENAQKRVAQLQMHIHELALESFGKTRDPLTLSIGIAVFPEHGMQMESLLRAADNALYRAKSAGRNQMAVAEL